MKRLWLDKNGRRILNKILTVIVIILALILLLGYLQDLNGKIDILGRYAIQQDGRIEELELANAQLERVVVHQHETIQEIQSNSMKVSINNVPIENEMPIHNEQKEIHKEFDVKELLNPTTITATIITTTIAVGKTITSLIPSIP